MIDQVKCLPPVVGLGENLETYFWHADGQGRRYGADVRCRICGQSVGCRVKPDGSMSSLDYNFWLHHFQLFHADLLPSETRTEL